MSKNKKDKKKSWFKQSTRLVGMDPVTFEEWWRVKINRLQLISIVVLIFISFLLINYALFSFTPLGNILPENVQDRSKNQLKEQMEDIDILHGKIDAQDSYIKNLQQVILGEIPIDSVYLERNFKDESSNDFELDTSLTAAEEALTAHIQVSNDELSENKKDIFKNLFLFDPVKGEISREFRTPNHPGVDVVTKKNEQIKACLDGIVLHSSYDDKDGYTVILSHQNEIVSVYKHAQKILVDVGKKVTAGTAIAIVGNTGERTTGPHLHFELWSDMGPLNPLDYLSFGQ
jgi:murein DD-endopeptidase MepM/ murein hydrolase activator NlpD